MGAILVNRSVGRLVSILYRKNQVYLNMVLKPYNITASELPVMTYLFGHDGASQEEMSTYLMIDKAATARAIQSLSEKGYLRKEKDPEDQRANRITLTAAAMALEGEIRGHLQAWSGFLTDGLDETAVNTMFEVLERMVQKVETKDLKNTQEDI